MNDGRVKVTGKPSKYFSLTTSSRRREIYSDASRQQLEATARDILREQQSHHYVADDYMKTRVKKGSLPLA